MHKNIGTLDRIVRLIIGVACLVGAFFAVSIIGKIGLAILGLFAIYEALVGWCAFYAVIGKNTCPVE